MLGPFFDWHTPKNAWSYANNERFYWFRTGSIHLAELWKRLRLNPKFAYTWTRQPACQGTMPPLRQPDKQGQVKYRNPYISPTQHQLIMRKTPNRVLNRTHNWVFLLPPLRVWCASTVSPSDDTIRRWLDAVVPLMKAKMIKPRNKSERGWLVWCISGNNMFQLVVVTVCHWSVRA